jgi:hypothetical protein
MAARADFTSDEWNVIFQAPAFAALYIIQAGSYNPAVAYRKLMVGIMAITETATRGADSELVKAIRAAIDAGQRPYYPETFPIDADEARWQTLNGCWQAARLLGQRVPDGEASAYVEWLIAIGEAVATVPDYVQRDHDLVAPGVPARSALETLAATLKGA